NNLYPITHGRTLDVRLLPDPNAANSPHTALSTLKEQAPVRLADTDTSSWLLVDIPVNPELGEHAVDIPSQHTKSLACWDADTLQSLGTADRSQTTGSLRTSKQGFAVMLGGRDTPLSLLCHATFAGQGLLTV